MHPNRFKTMIVSMILLAILGCGCSQMNGGDTMQSNEMIPASLEDQAITSESGKSTEESAVKKGELKNGTLVNGGLTREYTLYLPVGLGEKAPLVFALHGFTESSTNMMYSSRLNRIADREGFAVCYPQGSRTDDGKTFWEAGYAFTQKYGVDDVAFLSQLAHELQSMYGFHEENTFVTGMSNGADMTILLGVKATDVFHAFAPVCGCMMDVTWESHRDSPAVPVLMINSDKDPITRWEGDMENHDGWGAYHSTDDLTQFFASKIKSVISTVTVLPDVYKADMSSVVETRYANPDTSIQVRALRVEGGGHDWPGFSGNMDIDASEEVWAFFKQYIEKP